MVTELDLAKLAEQIKKRADDLRSDPNVWATPVMHSAHLAAALVLEGLAEALAASVK